jgi:RNA polymerase sigma-70 factor, ECF subfamily
MSGFRGWAGRPQSDDHEEFGRLYDDTSADLLAFLLRRCRTAEDAADCLSETYRIAWEKRSRIPAGDDARPWLFGVARNVLRRERTSDERTAAVSRDLAIAARLATATSGGPDSPVVAALAALSPLDREIVTMLSWDGLAPREVAVVLGLSPNVVRVRAHRARQRLRVRLAAGDGAESVDTPDSSSAAAGRGG